MIVGSAQGLRDRIGAAKQHQAEDSGCRSSFYAVAGGRGTRGLRAFGMDAERSNYSLTLIVGLVQRCDDLGISRRNGRRCMLPTSLPAD